MANYQRLSRLTFDRKIFFYVLKQILSFLFFLIIKNECYVSILRILGLNHIRLLRQYLVHF